jgi:hypothetical protein
MVASKTYSEGRGLAPAHGRQTAHIMVIGIQDNSQFSHEIHELNQRSM